MSGLRNMAPDRRASFDAAAVTGLVLCAEYGFVSSYGGVRHLIVAAIGVVLALLVGQALIALRIPVLLGALVAVVVHIVIGGVVALPERAIAGFVPSADTITGAVHGSVRGWRELITTAPPVSGIGSLMMIPFLCGFIGGLATYTAMRKVSDRPARLVFCIVPAAAVLAASVLTGVREPASLVVQGVVFGALAVAWMAARVELAKQRLPGAPPVWRRTGSSLGMLAIAGVIGMIVTPSLPFVHAEDRVVWRNTVTPPFDPRVHPSPLSGYRQYLAKPEQREAPLFRISGLPDDTLVRLATLDTYDGLAWRPGFDDADPSDLDSGYFARVGSEIESDFGGEVVELAVTIESYTGIWVPDVGEVLSLEFEGGPRDRELNEAFRYNRVTDTAVVEIGLREGDRYVMTVRLPPPAGAVATQTIAFEQPVGDTAEIENLTTWAQKLPGVLDIGDVPRRVDVIAEFMQQNGAYSDGDQERGQEPSRAGHSAVRLAEFVDADRGLVGNAEQYASTFALVLRSVLQVPSRVVMGFRSENREGDVVTVTGDDVEAWVEIPIEGVGWMPVLPTPERTETALKQKSQTPPQPDYDTQTPEPPPLVEPDFDEPATSRSGLADEAQPEEPEVAEEEAPEEPLISVSPWVAVTVAVLATPVVLFLLFAAVVVFVKARRRRRRRTRGRTDERIANGWSEVIDRGIDMGRPVPETATRREAALAVGPQTVPLAHRADEAVFGPVDPTDAEVEAYWAELEQALKGMRSELTIGDRVRAALNVSTIKRRRTTRSPEGREGRRRGGRRAG